MSNEVVEFTAGGVFAPANFEMSQRIAKALAASTMVPKEYQNNLGNCMIALDMSMRNGFSALMIMQNLHVIHGKPSWSGSFVAAAIRSCGRFDGVKFVMSDDKLSCYMEAREISNNLKITGPTVSIAMSKAEGWYDKPGSKWKTLPELMLQYRAATFFGRLHAAEVLMGLHTVEEILEDPKRFDLEIPSEKPADPLAAITANTEVQKPQGEVKAKVWNSTHQEIPAEVIESVEKLAASEGIPTTREKIVAFLESKFKGQMGYQIPSKAEFDRIYSVILNGVK